MRFMIPSLILAATAAQAENRPSKMEGDLHTLAQKILASSSQCDQTKNTQITKALEAQDKETGALKTHDEAMALLKLLEDKPNKAVSTVRSFNEKFLQYATDGKSGIALDDAIAASCPLGPRHTAVNALIESVARKVEFSAAEKQRIFKAAMTYVTQPGTPNSYVMLASRASTLSHMLQATIADASTDQQGKLKSLSQDLFNQQQDRAQKASLFAKEHPMPSDPRAGTPEQKQALVSFLKEELKALPGLEKRLLAVGNGFKIKK